MLLQVDIIVIIILLLTTEKNKQNRFEELERNDLLYTKYDFLKKEELFKIFVVEIKYQKTEQNNEAVVLMSYRHKK